MRSTVNLANACRRSGIALSLTRDDRANDSGWSRIPLPFRAYLVSSPRRIISRPGGHSFVRSLCVVCRVVGGCQQWRNEFMRLNRGNAQSIIQLSNKSRLWAVVQDIYSKKRLNL